MRPLRLRLGCVASARIAAPSSHGLALATKYGQFLPCFAWLRARAKW
jgi:hypothetical protein